MTTGLVGSEMCIRDSLNTHTHTHTEQPTGQADGVEEIIHSLRHGPQVERLLVGLETLVEVEHLQVAPGKCILDLQFIR